MKHLFSESSTVLMHTTLHTTSPFTGAVISEALWRQCAKLQHDRLL